MTKPTLYALLLSVNFLCYFDKAQIAQPRRRSLREANRNATQQLRKESPRVGYASLVQ